MAGTTTFSGHQLPGLSDPSETAQKVGMEPGLELESDSKFYLSRSAGN